MKQAKKKATRAGMGKVVKPRAWKGMYRVGTTVTGAPVLYRRQGLGLHRTDAIVTQNPEAVASLAEWMTLAAEWMREQEKRRAAR